MMNKKILNSNQLFQAIALGTSLCGCAKGELVQNMEREEEPQKSAAQINNEVKESNLDVGSGVIDYIEETNKLIESCENAIREYKSALQGNEYSKSYITLLNNKRNKPLSLETIFKALLISYSEKVEKLSKNNYFDFAMKANQRIYDLIKKEDFENKEDLILKSNKIKYSVLYHHMNSYMVTEKESKKYHHGALEKFLEIKCIDIKHNYQALDVLNTIENLLSDPANLIYEDVKRQEYMNHLNNLIKKYPNSIIVKNNLAFHKLNKALSIFEAKKDYKGLIKTLEEIYFESSSRTIQTLKLDKILFVNYNTYASKIMHESIEKKKDALKYYYKAIKLYMRRENENSNISDEDLKNVILSLTSTRRQIDDSIILEKADKLSKDIIFGEVKDLELLIRVIEGLGITTILEEGKWQIMSKIDKQLQQEVLVNLKKECRSKVEELIALLKAPKNAQLDKYIKNLLDLSKQSKEITVTLFECMVNLCTSSNDNINIKIFDAAIEIKKNNESGCIPFLQQKFIKKFLDTHILEAIELYKKSELEESFTLFEKSSFFSENIVKCDTYTRLNFIALSRCFKTHDKNIVWCENLLASSKNINKGIKQEDINEKIENLEKCLEAQKTKKAKRGRNKDKKEKKVEISSLCPSSELNDQCPSFLEIESYQKELDLYQKYGDKINSETKNIQENEEQENSEEKVNPFTKKNNKKSLSRQKEEKKRNEVFAELLSRKEQAEKSIELSERGAQKKEYSTINNKDLNKMFNKGPVVEIKRTKSGSLFKFEDGTILSGHSRHGSASKKINPLKKDLFNKSKEV